jgi:hypothetical protein
VVKPCSGSDQGRQRNPKGIRRDEEEIDKEKDQGRSLDIQGGEGGNGTRSGKREGKEKEKEGKKEEKEREKRKRKRR